MREARQYKCPGCGGQVPESARVCGYCRGPIATVRCSHCYHMNIPEALHCSGCGRELGLEPLGRPDTLECPNCKLPFDAYCGGPGMLHDCNRCGGQFVEHALLRDLLERQQVYGGSAPRRAELRLGSEPVRYVPCPQCQQHMNRRNFGGNSGVVVDVCQRHGIWFDTGELPRVLAFVEQGGLVRAKQREREEADRKMREARVAAAMAELPLSVAREPEPPLLLILGRACLDLLEWLTGSLRR